MTVSTSTAKVTYAGDGITTTPFATTFRFLQNADLLVTLSVDATGVETVQVLDTDFTVTGAGAATGGPVTMIVAPAVGETLIISRNMTITQETDYVENDPFPAETHEDALDKLTMIAQQQDENTNRTLTLPISTGVGVSAELPAPDALKFFRWNATETALEVSDISLLGAVVENDLSKHPPTIAAAKGRTDAVGTVVSTQGFTTAGDDGRGDYLVLTAGAFGGTPDELGDHTRSDGNILVLQHEGNVLAEQYGAVGNGTTDDLLKIRAALAAMKLFGAGIVNLGAKDYGISDVLDITSNVELIGLGGPGQFTTTALATDADFIALTKTRLVALAGFPATTPMVRLKTANLAKYAIHSARVKGMMIDCAAIADFGLDVVTVKNSFFEDLLIFRPVIRGVLEDVLPSAQATTDGNNATQFNLWDSVQVWLGNTGTGTGWIQEGSEVNNINQNSYRNTYIAHNDGPGIVFANCDTNSYYRMTTFAFGIGYGGVFDGDDVTSANFARSLRFYDLLFGGADAGGNTGTAQAGAATTITLAAGASATDDFYNDKLITLTGGTGSGQTRIITDYNGTTKIATVATWGTNPDATSTYSIPGGGGCHVKSGTSKNSSGHAFFGYEDNTNGGKEPIVDAGAHVDWHGERKQELQDSTTYSMSLVDTGAFGTGNTGEYKVRARLDDGSMQDVTAVQTTGGGSAGSETFRLDFLTWDSGAMASRAFILQGLVVGAPTGGDKGLGTINATAVFDDNVLLTCYVFDQAIDGNADPVKWDAKAPDGKLHDPMRKFSARIGGEYDPLDIDKYAAHWKTKKHLTAMPNEEGFDPEDNLAVGSWVQRLVETVEVQAVHIENLNQRLKALEP